LFHFPKLDKTMKNTFSILFALFALTATAQTPAGNQSVTATFDVSKTGAPISPYLYGQFLEHIGNLVYSSLWSEMLDDRKFYYAVAPRQTDDSSSNRRGFGGGRRGVGPGRWNPIGPIDSVVMGG
jgi:alpha-N-arabinofuranosidase